MGFFYFLGQKKFYLHVLISIVLTAFIFWGVFKLLAVFTHHGEVYLVPDFSGQTLPELDQKGYNQYFDFIVIDSVYDAGHLPGSVVMQNPLPGSQVKQGRHIYLTIVAKTPAMVTMPDLRNLSLRQALVLLEGKGLRVQKLQYVDYFAKNAVIDQLLHGEPVETGTKIPKGTAIGLVVGRGEHPTPVPLPLIIGKKMRGAHEALNYASLNVGNEYFIVGNDTVPVNDSVFANDTVLANDTVRARVFRTDPPFMSHSLMDMGSPVDIWYRTDTSFHFQQYIRQMMADTTQQDTVPVSTNQPLTP